GSDVVHAHGLRAGFIAVLALRGAGTRLVVTWHNAVLGGGPRRRLLVALERVVARGADVTLGASTDLVARAAALGARDARLGPVAAPPLAAALRSRDEVRAELLREADVADPATPVLLAVGRLAEQKDYPTLLTALGREWPDGVARPLLVIAGDGPLGEALQAGVREHHLPVLLLGHRSDVADLLSAADVYVLSSRWEARALVVQEAARAGVPIVATHVGGVPDLVEGAAELVPAGDPAALATALAGVVSDPDRRARLGRAARQRSTLWPDEAATTRQVRAVYAGLAPGRG
ncbi:MAG: glycosyltransferase, partial [Actinomycetota bacterium]